MAPISSQIAVNQRIFHLIENSYDNLFTKGKLVKEFNSKKLGLPGRIVKVFKL